jgi:hypothetical protein
MSLASGKILNLFYRSKEALRLQYHLFLSTIKQIPSTNSACRDALKRGYAPDVSIDDSEERSAS